MKPSNATHLFDATTLRVLAVTARKVEALFNELQTIPGPSQRARNDGARNGWEVPLAWDDTDLDHFAVDFNPPEPQPVDAPLRFEELYAELRYLGYSDQEIARREGIEVESLHQRLRRTDGGSAALPRERSARNEDGQLGREINWAALDDPAAGAA
jgi:hypothetical protein